jgi:hypothetical protein
MVNIIYELLICTKITKYFISAKNKMNNRNNMII